MRKAAQMLSGAMLDLLYPTDADCVLCGAQSPILPGCGVCSACRDAMRPSEPLEIPGSSWAGAAFTHEGPARRMVHHLKFGGAQYLATGMGAWMAQAWKDVGRPRPDAIVPVPLGPLRLKERGYNQALLLAQAMGDYLNIPVIESLVRVRDTQQQARLGKHERAKNIANVFCYLSQHALDGRKILLIDDVATTGATAAGCVSILKSAGIQGVDAFFFAYSPFKKR